MSELACVQSPVMAKVIGNFSPVTFVTSNEKFIVVDFLILSHICLSLPFRGAFHISIVKCYMICK